MATNRELGIVVIGGGTGLAVLLKGLKKYTSRLTAIVTVSDDGGSSGRLRAEMGVLPPGDIRNCLVALAETETLMNKVFQHRFQAGGGIQGHSLGNLLLVAMSEIAGDFISAIQEVSKVLAVRGVVLPATLEPVVLAATMENGGTVIGETRIRNHEGKIQRISLIPDQCLPVPETLKAIQEADAIVLGPGSLYTSIIPNLLVKGVAESITQASAPVIYVSNIMTEQGETDGFTAADHLQSIKRHLNRQLVDFVIINSGVIDEHRLRRYRQERAIPVSPAYEDIQAMGINIIKEDLVSNDDVAWHDSDKLARTILTLLD
ncbi:MAG: YvcK family protein [Syntrophomonadaceae bacterium]|jgi:uncharacterized cofD-like protein|nr:YvcK family protein [Syntrophomonadaceae bacterium]